MDKRAYQFTETFKEVFEWEKVCHYLKVFWPILYGWYASFFAIEIIIIMIGNTHDTEFLAAWVVNFNVLILCFVAAQGTSQITRTDIIIPIQQSRPIEAKKYAILGIINKTILC